MQNIKKDIFGNIPELGSIIIFNPPKYKGLSHGVCTGFTLSGCLKLEAIVNGTYHTKYDIDTKGYYILRTDFVIKN